MLFTFDSPIFSSYISIKINAGKQPASHYVVDTAVSLNLRDIHLLLRNIYLINYKSLE